MNSKAQAWLFSDRAGRRRGSGRYLSCDRSAGWNKLLPSYQLDSSVRQFQSELHNIKMRAAAENVGFQLVYANGAADYTIQRDSAVLVTKPLPDRCRRYKRRNNLFLAKRNRERQPNPGAKLRWDVQTSGGESDRQSSDLQAE